MEELTQFIQANFPYAPYIVFGASMPTGFNIPISEDAMSFVSAVLARNYPAYLAGLFITMAPPQRSETIRRFNAKYGTATILFGHYSGSY